MSIDPIIRSVRTKAPPALAFEIFSRRIGEWWPKGMTIGAQHHADVVIEPQAGGRWYELDAEGAETPWGHVIAYDPPNRLLLAWQIGAEWSFDPDLVTEVEVRFEAASEGGTLVTLEHRNLERYGAAAEKHAGMLGGGWPGLLQGFADLADLELEPSR